MAKQTNMRIGPLETVGNIKTEMAKVYRATKLGKIDPALATCLKGILIAMKDMTIGDGLEKRIAALEAQRAAPTTTTPATADEIAEMLKLNERIERMERSDEQRQVN